MQCIASQLVHRNSFYSNCISVLNYNHILYNQNISNYTALFQAKFKHHALYLYNLHEPIHPLFLIQISLFSGFVVFRKFKHCRLSQNSLGKCKNWTHIIKAFQLQHRKISNLTFLVFFGSSSKLLGTSLIVKTLNRHKD